MLLKDERSSQPREGTPTTSGMSFVADAGEGQANQPADSAPTTSAPPSSLMLLKSERNSQPTAQPATSGTHPVADALDRTATPAE
jgi:hypothetical protein